MILYREILPKFQTLVMRGEDIFAYFTGRIFTCQKSVHFRLVFDIQLIETVASRIHG